MMVLQVSLNFDPVKEKLKVRHIYVLMKKSITLGKIDVTFKSFVPPFFNHFSLSLNKRKKCSNKSYAKETKCVLASAVDLLNIRIENLH